MTTNGVRVLLVTVAVLVVAAGSLGAAERRRLTKPWGGAAAERALEASLAQSKRDAAARPEPRELGAPVYRELGAELSKEDAAVVFFWVDEKGRDVRVSIPLLGEVDAEIAASVVPESQGTSRVFAYSYKVTTFAGSRRAIWRLDIATDATIRSGRAPESWRFRFYKGGSPGFNAMPSGWTWDTLTPRRQRATAIVEGFNVASGDLPGLVKLEVTGFWPFEERKRGDTRDDGDEEKPEEMLRAWDRLVPYLGPAKGYTLGPDVFPAISTERFAKVSELLTRMIGLGWIDEGKSGDELRSSVDALTRVLTSADKNVVAEMAIGIERLVNSQLEQGKVIPEVRDFLLAHLSGLRSEDTVKK